MNLQLKLITTDREQLKARDIVENHHSYVPTYDSVGRRIDWLVMVDGEICGMIGIGSSTYPPCKDILNKLNVSKSEYKLLFNNIANNWRFCLTKKIPNLGTQVLKQLRTIAPIEWERKYGDKLLYLITFVGGGNNGAVYRADNWEVIGHTSGLPEHKSVSMKWDTKDTIKQKFVKPTGENQKIIFFKKLRRIPDVKRWVEIDLF
jgi:hypothetical protein